MHTQKPVGEKLTIGLDLGDRRHHACVLAETGDVVAEEVLVNTREVLAAFSARYPGATCVMETGTHSPWVSRLLSARKHPVIVANARKLRAISASHTKSDREDAQMPFDRLRALSEVETARPPRPRRSETAQPGAPPPRGYAACPRAPEGARSARAQPREPRQLRALPVEEPLAIAIKRARFSPMPTVIAKSDRIKTEAIKLVRSLPASSTWDDLMYRIYVRQKIEAGLADFQSGRVHTHASIRKEFALP